MKLGFIHSWRLAGVSIFAASLMMVANVQADVPLMVVYQGTVTQSDGAFYTGQGYFKFSLLDSSGATAYWSNDGATANGNEPTTAVSVPVKDGKFAVQLGNNVDFSNMSTLTADVFSNASLNLRVWFSETGAVGSFQQFQNDTALLSSGFAIKAAVADKVVDAPIINSTHIVDGTVTNADIAANASISAAKIDSNGLDADTLDGKDSTLFAANVHSHNYAATTHTHNYAATTHTHNYAATNHTHPAPTTTSISQSLLVSSQDFPITGTWDFCALTEVNNPIQTGRQICRVYNSAGVWYLQVYTGITTSTGYALGCSASCIKF